MKRKWKIQNQVKGALKESDWLQKPAKKSTSSVLELFCRGLISVIVTLLLFPFTWASLVLDIVVLLLAIGLALKFIKSKGAKAFALRWWVVAVTMFLFAAVCPFIVAPKPVYIAVSEAIIRANPT